jgi:repeat uncharacterized protein DUF347
VSFNNIVSPKVEIFYWVTILFSKTLGTGLGDFFAADSALGYEGAAVVLAGAPALLAFAYFYTKISRRDEIGLHAPFALLIGPRTIHQHPRSVHQFVLSFAKLGRIELTYSFCLRVKLIRSH